MFTGFHRHVVGSLPEPTITAGQIPEIGRVIAVISTRKAWRVFRIDDVHPANWTAQTTAVWREAGEPEWETWRGRERGLGVEPPRNPQPNGKDRRGIRLCPWWKGEQWVYLEEPWPECVDCGLLWPCPCHDRNVAADKAMAELDRLAEIMPGCCWACNEPVTGRQHSIVFEGENLLMPGADPAVFHTSHSRKPEKWGYDKGTCRVQAERYEDRWVSADEGRRVRLRCPGILWSHFGYRECTTGGLCPGEDASHRSGVMHCTVASYVWTRGADGEGDARSQVPVTNCGHLGCKGPTAVTAAAEVTEASDD